jgi:hypothetical protein
MKRTPFSVVAAILAIGAAIGVISQQALSSSGLPGITPPISLTLVLIAIGIIVVALAVPVRRAVKDARRRVDPFFALRVLVLAKASALAGSLLGGVGVGFIIYFLTRTVPALGSVGYSIGMSVGAAILLIGGLVAEEMCRIPPPTDEDEEPAGARS